MSARRTPVARVIFRAQSPLIRSGRLSIQHRINLSLEPTMSKPWRLGQPRTRLSCGVANLLLVIAVAASPALAVDIIVTTTDDELNVDGDCSLREAVQSANTDTGIDNCQDPGVDGDDVVVLADQSYTLTIVGRAENANQTGDLDLTDTGGSITIRGDNATTTFVQAGTDPSNGIDRVFLVHPSVVANFEDLTIRFGRTDETVTGDSQDDGGGIRINGGTVTVNRASIDQNAAQGGTSVDGGGIRMNAGSNLTVVASTISNNTSADRGAGIHVDGTVAGGSGTGALTLTVRNSTISGNSAADDGGGLSLGASLLTLVLDNVTIAGNSSGDASAGAGMDVGAGTSLTVRNTVIADNGSRDLDCSGETLIVAYTLIETAHDCTISGGTGNLTGDPVLGALALQGGPTATHAPLMGSALIDGGDALNGGTGSGACNGTSGTIPVDQRSAERAQGPGLGGGGCDIGAFETASTTPPVPVELQSFRIE